MSGFVVMHRSLIDHPAFRNESEAMAFAWMVMRASWKTTRVRYKGRSITLERGQLSVSQRDMAASFDRDKAWVERLWKRLRSEAMIEVACEAGLAVITICNYCKYQNISDEREAVCEAQSEAGARQARGTEQQDNKITRNKSSVAKATSQRKDHVAKPDGVDNRVWADFLKQRKTPFTETALAGFQREADKAGVTLNEALMESCARGWQGFKAEWIKGNGYGRSNQAGGRDQDRRDGVAKALDRRLGIDGPLDGYPIGGSPEDSISAPPRLADMR